MQFAACVHAEPPNFLHPEWRGVGHSQCATLNVRRESIIQAAEPGGDPPESSGLMIVPRRAGVMTSGNLPAAPEVEEDGLLIVSRRLSRGPFFTAQCTRCRCRIGPDESPVPMNHSLPSQSSPHAVTPYDDAPDFVAPARQTSRGVAAPQPSCANSGYAPGTSGFRATVECDAPAWMEPYYGRTGQLPKDRETSPTQAPSVVLPADFVAWWDPLVRQSAGLASNTVPVEVATLVQQALAHAPQVQVLQADPEVQYTIVRQEEAAFDWRTSLTQNTATSMTRSETH